MKAVKLPSGRWRARAYLYTDEFGRKHTKSFTADTKREAERMASAYDQSQKTVNMTVREAVRKYIDTKAPVLSPSTVRGYESIIKNYIVGEIAGKKLDALTKHDVQAWVSRISQEISAKSTSNAYGLLTATQKFYLGTCVQAKLPQQMHPMLYTPTDNDICTILNLAEDDHELHLAILLGSFCGLRRGEICALNASDYHDGQLYVSRAISRGTDAYVVKAPKTDGSTRLVPVPALVIPYLPEAGRYVTSSPNAITSRFLRLVDKAGLPHFRFHDLRHYYATTLAGKVPTRILCQFGGWKTDKMMKRVYLGIKDDEFERQKENAASIFDSVISKKLPQSCHDDIRECEKP